MIIINFIKQPCFIEFGNESIARKNKRREQNSLKPY